MKLGDLIVKILAIGLSLYFIISEAYYIINISGAGFSEMFFYDPDLFIITILMTFPFMTNTYQARLLGRYLVFGLFAMSFDLLWGYAGIMNFGHAVFFGLGAYSTGIIMKYVNI